MPRRLRFIAIALALVAPATAVTSAAHAQSIAPTMPPTFAERLVNGQDLGQSTRPVGLNPLGINYSDCAQDMVLQFSVTLSGFTGQDNLEIWATTLGDCTQPATRGLGPGTSVNQATCWLVGSLTLPTLAGSHQFTVPVRALVGPEGGIPPAGTLVGDQGIDACQHQPSDAALPITIWFLPIMPGGALDPNGTAYQYPVISADLVGPPAPTDVSVGQGDTILTANWMPNSDADTQGYDVFVDPPPPGSLPTAPTNVPYCLGTSTSSGSSSSGASSSTGGSSPSDAAAEVEGASADGAAEDGSEDTAAAASDATVATSSASDATAAADAPQDVAVEASCITINGGGSLVPSDSGGACESVALSAPPVFTVGTPTTTAVTEDSGEADAAEDSGLVQSSVAGIASIPCQYLNGSSCTAGMGAYTSNQVPSVTGLSSSTFTITGLNDGQSYNIVVSAVDGSGNVGPQSSPLHCSAPAPINDFYKVYRLAGGTAGGGFCALDAPGAPVDMTVLVVPAAATAFGLARRRRRRT